MSATVLTLEIAAANLRAARIAREAEFLRQWVEIQGIKLLLADGLSPREVARTLHIRKSTVQRAVNAPVLHWPAVGADSKLEHLMADSAWGSPERPAEVLATIVLARTEGVGA